LRKFAQFKVRTKQNFPKFQLCPPHFAKSKNKNNKKKIITGKSARFKVQNCYYKTFKIISTPKPNLRPAKRALIKSYSDITLFLNSSVSFKNSNLRINSSKNANNKFSKLTETYDNINN